MLLIRPNWESTSKLYELLTLTAGAVRALITERLTNAESKESIDFSALAG
jgi:hypothetical protein